MTTYNFKLLPTNARGAVSISSGSAVPLTLTDRAEVPLPPGAVKVNGDFWPNGRTYSGDVTLSWAHRNRTSQSGYTIVPQDAASVGSPEGNYTVDVLVAGTVKRTTTGITGTSFVYTHAMRLADDSDPTKTVKFRITPVNGTLVGTARTTDSFLMS
jgi:hypothetical protein